MLTMTGQELDTYLGEARDLVVDEIRSSMPRNDRLRPVLYDHMLDYPLRAAKGLRPALCIATCRAFGGPIEGVLRSAAVLELFHNAFLIHDDIEDGSEIRRTSPTLHRTLGTPIAINVGDAMLALALELLLENMRLVGLGKALRILTIVTRMARESTEGQALELDWIRHQTWELNDTDYVRMVYKKTSWYTFIAPVLIGGIVAGLPDSELSSLRKFAALLGIAFQIQDDVLNLIGDERLYGKEAAGDLWEGKHTLILLHALRSAEPEERDAAARILAKARPDLLPEPAIELNGTDIKTQGEINRLLAMIKVHGSLDHASRVADQYAAKALAILNDRIALTPSIHRDFLAALVRFVIHRDR